jgi:hypothetical protein
MGSNFGPVASPLTVDLLAAEPRWEPARLALLQGRCRGDLLGPWGQNVAKRFGAAGVARVRARLAPGLAIATIADVLTAKDWVPVYAQIAVTEAIVDEFLGGEMRALYPLLVEDTRAGIGRVQLALVRTLGAGRVFKLTTRTFRDIYESGTAEVDLDTRAHRVRQTFRGSPLFANPTWRILQLFAMRTLLELATTPGSAIGDDAGPDRFSATASW